MWVCPYCKRENRDFAKYCIACGREKGAVSLGKGSGSGGMRWLPWVLLGLLGMACVALGLILLLRNVAPASVDPAETEETIPAAAPEVVITLAPLTTPAPETEAEPAADAPAAAPLLIVTPTPEPVFSGFLTEPGQLSEKGLSQMKRVMEDTIAENVRTSWNPVEHLESSEYAGYVLLRAKGESQPIRNILILAYHNRVNIRIPAEGVDKTLEYYYTLRFENVWCNADGSLILPSPVRPEGEVKANVPGHYFYYKGYSDLDALRRAMVDPERENYDVTEMWA